VNYARGIRLQAGRVEYTREIALKGMDLVIVCGVKLYSREIISHVKCVVRDLEMDVR
jgi:hypothetical protein